jgi:hypothetical protein
MNTPASPAGARDRAAIRHKTRVASAYSRLDSCETARWNKLWKVFSQVNPGGVNPGGPMIRASGAPPSN